MANPEVIKLPTANYITKSTLSDMRVGDKRYFKIANWNRGFLGAAAGHVNSLGVGHFNIANMGTNSDGQMIDCNLVVTKD